MSKTRNFFWPAAQSSQLLEFVAREKNFSGIYINLLTFLGARPLLIPKKPILPIPGEHVRAIPVKPSYISQRFIIVQRTGFDDGSEPNAQVELEGRPRAGGQARGRGRQKAGGEATVARRPRYGRLGEEQRRCSIVSAVRARSAPGSGPYGRAGWVRAIGIAGIALAASRGTRG